MKAVAYPKKLRITIARIRNACTDRHEMETIRGRMARRETITREEEIKFRTSEVVRPP